MTQSNLIDQMEHAIKAGQFGEPVLAVRVYSRTTSQRHLDAGATFRLYMSFDTIEQAQAEVDSETDGLDIYEIRSNEPAPVFEVKKTNLGEQNRGICGNRNNCRYNGRSICWALLLDGENYGALTRKRDAELVAKIMNENFPSWDKIGDIFGMVQTFCSNNEETHQSELFQTWDFKEV
ncbi:MAG: hypothetical protein COA78_06875 [Blastopirellula sp.]|nr:MAG: hypothetical protein COA78_06875 [Blastopirellula sp.]